MGFKLKSMNDMRLCGHRRIKRQFMQREDEKTHAMHFICNKPNGLRMRVITPTFFLFLSFLLSTPTYVACTLFITLIDLTSIKRNPDTILQALYY